MPEPKVSIIVPVYKSEKYIGRCLKSLKEQTLSEIEIILVDDESPDNCPKICDEEARKDERIKVIHKKNEGAGMARNSGMEAARGKYIGFVDSDDYVSLDMFERLYLAAERNNVQLVLSGACFVGGNVFGSDGEREEVRYFDKETLFSGKDDIKKLMLGVSGALPHEPLDSRYGVSVWKNLYLRETIEKNNVRFLSERDVLSEDTIFLLDLLPFIETAVGLPDAFYMYCRNGDSVSKSYNPAHLEKCVVLIDEIEKRLAAVTDFAEYKIYIDRLAQSYGRFLCSQAVMNASENNIKWKDLRKRLEDICTTERIEAALKNYPWYKLPIKQAVFAFLIKHKLYLAQKAVIKLRDK